MAPVLRVADVGASAEFYRERLGFDCPEEAIYSGPEGPIYAIARRAGCQVHLGRMRSGQHIEPGRPPNALGAYVYVDDVEMLHVELAGRGAPVSGPPHTAAYGLREISVTDPDGYVITFGAATD